MIIMDQLARFEAGFHNGKYGVALFAGVKHRYSFAEGGFNGLNEFLNKHRGRFIYLAMCYDLKNQIEKLHTRHAASIQFPMLELIVPERVALEKNYEGPNSRQAISSLEQATELNQFFLSKNIQKKPPIIQGITKESYTKKIHYLKSHITKGNIYEINFCIESIAAACNLDTVETWLNLMKATEAPFGIYYKNNNLYALCASPERFLFKNGTMLMAQPMKGTAPRSTDPVTDLNNKLQLRENTKEQAENVMIVDLMRNDLSKIAKSGSVKVDELFGVYTFKNVHQMISTVSCELSDKTTFVEILKSTFPMGSMTGAPKIKAMELIDEAETFSRNLFSGSLGYFDPDGNFDLNVVIRTVLYDANQQIAVCRSGSAITANSDAGNEFDECHLKMKALLHSLRCEE